MRFQVRRSNMLGTLALAASSLRCAHEGPPPFPEVVMIVDTDLAVPRLAARLRVDIFTSDGRWFLTRDLPRIEPKEWPVSFGVMSRDEMRDTDLIVRLRVYPEGKVRDYRGVRYAPPSPRSEPTVARSVDEMCAQAVELPLGGTVTVRRGRDPLFSEFTGAGCEAFAGCRTGAAAVFLDVTKKDTYRIGVLGTTPSSSGALKTSSGTKTFPFEHVALEMRSDCVNPSTAIVCEPGADATTLGLHLPVLTQTLSPGRHTFIVTGFVPSDGPTDIAIGAATVDAFAKLDPTVTDFDALPAVAAWPLDLSDTATPQTEPLPSVTVDRLVRVRLRHGAIDAVRVTLRGACLGREALLGDGSVDFAAARTCIDESRPFEPIAVEPAIEGDGDRTTSAQNTFGEGRACPAEAGSDRVCIPGTSFVLGSREDSALLRDSSAPERTVVVPTFLLDKYEVTVGRYRDALSSGMTPSDRDLPRKSSPAPLCSFTDTPGSYEDFALTCISWYGARAFCQFVGGDLPTEAQWEYAAKLAGRTRETRFAWGDESPQCACDGTIVPCHAPIFGRTFAGVEPTCSGPGKPASVYASVGLNGDETPLGIVGMGGGVMEWMLDDLESYSGRCWSSVDIGAPACFSEDAVFRTTRGGHWFAGARRLVVSKRSGTSPAGGGVNVGFRCAYPIP